MSSEITVLGEASVYPGHSVIVALCIVRAFKSLDEAKGRSPNSDYPTALTSELVPGAGGNVWAGLALLEHIHEGHLTWEQALALADENWASCDSQAKGGYSDSELCREGYKTRWRKGQEQADRFKAILQTEATPWLTKPVSMWEVLRAE